MSMRTILIVDDEPKILELLKSYLEAEGFRALCARSGMEALSFFEGEEVDLILLDLMLPGFSGEQFCKRVRESSDVPVIMITAKVEERSVIHGLNIGADDYVCKPFSPRQVVARVKAALRRAGMDRGGTDALLSCGDLIVDTESRSVRRGGEALNLTRDEYNILVLLMSRKSRIFTRDEILDAVKGRDFDGFDRSVDSHIKRLRAKIGDDPKSPRYITTVYGVGYRLGEGE
jgi:two-component system OmpR family response regulator